MNSSSAKRKRTKSLSEVDKKPFATKKFKLGKLLILPCFFFVQFQSAKLYFLIFVEDELFDDEDELPFFNDLDDDTIDNDTILDLDSVEAEDGSDVTTEAAGIDNMDIDLPFPDLVKDINFDVQAMLRQRDKHGQMGDKALETWTRECTLAMSAIENLYKCISNAPKDSVEFDPEGLSAKLMPHQRQVRDDLKYLTHWNLASSIT